MSDDPNYIELEVLVPTRLQYSTVRLRAGRRVRVLDVDPAPGADVAEAAREAARAARNMAWDLLADELAVQAARQADRIITRFLKEQKGTNGDAPPAKRY